MEEHINKETAKELSEEQLVNDAFQHLLDSYRTSRHRKKVDIITKAFNFARQAHKGVRRLSGEPYDQDSEREEQLLTQVLDLERIDERIYSFLESFH